MPVLELAKPIVKTSLTMKKMMTKTLANRLLKRKKKPKSNFLNWQGIFPRVAFYYSPLFRKSKRMLDSDADSDASDSKPNQSGAVSPTADALFGDADDISSGEEDEQQPEQKKPVVNKIVDSDREAEDMDQDERVEKEPEEIVPETKIEHEIPYIRADVGKELHFVKLPNFLSVDPRPFDSQVGNLSSYHYL